MLTTMGNAGLEFLQGISVHTEVIQARTDIPLYSFKGGDPSVVIGQGTSLTVYRRDQLVMNIVMGGKLIGDVSMAYISVEVELGVSTYGYVPTELL